MPGRVIGIELPLGYPGTIARTPDPIIMNRTVKDDSANIGYGKPVVLNGDNTYSAFGADNTSDQFGGVAIREVKMATNYYDQNDVEYLPGQQCDVLERGSIVVKCPKGTPTAGGKVYVRIAANNTYPGSVIGDFEAEADGSNTVELTGVVWATGRIDADKCCELLIKERV